MTGGAPVGIFDSGVGGLTIAREIRERIPGESLLYFADTAWVPYGDRPLEVVRDRTLAVGRYLQDHGAKALVVACNTACGAGLESLRADLHVPVIGVEPAIKPAVAATRNGRVGVMATQAMLRSGRFQRLLHSYAAGVSVVAQACPGLVELVEAGCIAGPAVEARLHELLEPLKRAGVDVVVLGCTHYPLLAEPIRAELGSGVTLLDSGSAVARQTLRVLEQRGALSGGHAGSLRLLCSGDPLAMANTVERIWAEPVGVDGVAV